MKIQKIVVNCIAGFALVNITMSSAHSQSGDTPNSSYSFSMGGSCAMGGAWTQQALNQTNQIRKALLQVRDNPACKATSQAMNEYLTQLEANLKSAGSDSRSELRASQIPQEIAALRSFISTGAGSGQKESVLRLILNRSLESSLLSAENLQKTAGTAKNQQDTNIDRLGSRVRNTLSHGLDITTQMVGTIPQMADCLVEPQFGQMIAAGVSTLAAFVGSGQDGMGTRIAMAISKMTEATRNQKFARAFYRLNQVEFRTSLSCLLEATSENYCAVRDNRYLFDEIEKNTYKVQAQINDNKKFFELSRTTNGKLSSAMAGYYVLSQQVPLITDWLQKVQIGADPRLETDAQFQKDTLEKVNTLFISMKGIIGFFNQKSDFIKAMTDKDAQKNKTREMVQYLVELLSGGQGSSEFYTSKIPVKQMAFILAGVPVPAEVYAVNNTNFNFETWSMTPGNWEKIPGSGNIPQFLETIRVNLRLITDSAAEQAIVYYNKFFIVDKSSLYLRSLIGTNYTVKDSLLSVDKYLEDFQGRIEKYSKDQTVINSVIETRARIGRIVERYKAIQVLTEEVKKSGKTLPLQLIKKIQAEHEAFVNEVYFQFEVQLAKSGWLANRMASFVQYDYMLMLRNNLVSSKLLEEFFYMTGIDAHDRMMTLANSNQAAVKLDTDAAMNIGKKNIQAIEEVFANNLVAHIAELKLEVNGSSGSFLSRWYDNLNRSWMEGYAVRPGDEYLPESIRRSRGYWTFTKALFMDGDKYPFFFSLKGLSISPDTEFNSAKSIAAALCVQTLAFNDLRPFWHLCKDLALSPAHADSQIDEKIKADYLDYYQMSYGKIVREKSDPSKLINHSERICAYRDFQRRNMVLYLTLDMKKESEKHETKYSYEREVDTPAAQMEAATVEKDEPKAKPAARPNSVPKKK